MHKRMRTGIAVFTIAIGSMLLTHPALGADTSMFKCTADDIVNALNIVCPNGGTASNIRQTPTGCTFDATCS